jgi:hypothetical protein
MWKVRIRAIPGAGGDGGLHVVLVLQRQRVAAHEAGEERDLHHPDRDHGVDEARAEDGDDRQRQDDRREGEHHVHEPHHDGVDDAAAVAADQAEGDAAGEGDRRRDEADGERDAGAVDDAREDVAADLVGAEPELRRRRLERERDDLGVAVGQDPGSEQRGAGQQEPGSRRPPARPSRAAAGGPSC